MAMESHRSRCSLFHASSDLLPYLQYPIPREVVEDKGLVSYEVGTSGARVSLWKSALEKTDKEDSADQLPHERLLPKKVDEPTWTPLDHARYLERCMILLCHGGYFAGVYYEGDHLKLHKTFHRYITRRGQGGRQSTRDKSSRVMMSAGSHLRREGEKKHTAEVRDLLTSGPWVEALAAAQKIFIFTPGQANMAMFFDKDAPLLNKRDPRLRSITFPTERPSLEEAKRVHTWLTTATVTLPYSGPAPQPERERDIFDAEDTMLPEEGEIEALGLAKKKKKKKPKGKGAAASAPAPMPAPAPVMTEKELRRQEKRERAAAEFERLMSNEDLRLDEVPEEEDDSPSSDEPEGADAAAAAAADSGSDEESRTAEAAARANHALAEARKRGPPPPTAEQRRRNVLAEAATKRMAAADAAQRRADEAAAAAVAAQTAPAVGPAATRTEVAPAAVVIPQAAPAAPVTVAPATTAASPSPTAASPRAGTAALSSPSHGPAAASPRAVLTVASAAPASPHGDVRTTSVAAKVDERASEAANEDEDDEDEREDEEVVAAPAGFWATGWRWTAAAAAAVMAMVTGSVLLLRRRPRGGN